MDKITSAASSAKASWLCSDTITDRKWALRQLHGLADLLQENRDVILTQFSKDSEQTSQACEREFAILLLDLAAHIKEATAEADPKADKHKYTKPTTALPRPRGVCLILDDTDNPLRYSLAPFAAAIGARNTIVLASVSRSDTLRLIRETAHSYLDSLALHIIDDGAGSDQLADVAALFDHVTICSPDHTKWSALLASPKAHHVSVSGSYNLAVIPEGKVDVHVAVKSVLENASAGVRPYDGVDALLVHQSHFDAARHAVAKSSVNIGHAKSEAMGKLPAGCVELRTGVLSMDMGLRPGQIMEEVLSRVRNLHVHARALVVIPVSSLEQIVHLTEQVPSLSQLTLLGSIDKKVIHYLESRTTSHIFSTGSIPTIVPVTSHLFPLATTSFASALFTTKRAVHIGCQWPTLHLVQDMRRAYEGVIPKLAPEHPGGRVDFFLQVEYAVKTLGVVVGVCSIAGAYLGLRYLRYRLM